MLKLNPLPAYLRDYRRCIKRRWPIEELDKVIKLIQEGGHETELIAKYHDHQLSGAQWKRARDLHVIHGIRGDWVLIYRVEKQLKRLSLVRTGTHKEIFGK